MKKVVVELSAREISTLIKALYEYERALRAGLAESPEYQVGRDLLSEANALRNKMLESKKQGG